MVPHRHEQWQIFSYVAYHSLCLSLGYDSLFPCLHVWVSFQSCVQSKLVFHYVSSDVPCFPFVSSHLSSCFSSASQCKLSVMISSSCHHHDSLTIFNPFHPSVPCSLVTCCVLVLPISRVVIVFSCVFLFPHPRAPTFCACIFSRQLWQEISTSYWF